MRDQNRNSEECLYLQPFLRSETAPVERCESIGDASAIRQMSQTASVEPAQLPGISRLTAHFQGVSSMSFKRHRSSSTNSSTSSSSIQDTHHKLSRTANTNAHSLLCTLPPTCNHHPTPIANVKDLEAHYAMYHAHVCEQPGCGCVFPDERLLELVSAYPRGNSCMSLIEFYLFVC